MARGRKAIPVSQAMLTKVIEEIEADGPLPNRSALWEKVCAHPYCVAIGLKPQVAMLRAKSYEGLVIKTPLGKRGREKGCPPVAGGGRKRKPMAKEVMDRLSHITPPTLQNDVKRAAAGSIKAAVKLKCLDCCAYSKKEVALCTIKECPLWHFRPYKRVTEVTAHADVSTAGV